MKHELVRLCFCFLSLSLSGRVLRLFQAREHWRGCCECVIRGDEIEYFYIYYELRADRWRWYGLQWMRASRRVFRQMKQVRYAWRRPTSYLICAKVCTLWHRGYVNDCVDDRRAARNWDAGELHAIRPVLRKCHKICYSTLTIRVLHHQAEKYCLLDSTQKY